MVLAMGCQVTSFQVKAVIVGLTLYTVKSASLKLPSKVLVLTQEDIKEAGAFLRRPFLCLKR